MSAHVLRNALDLLCMLTGHELTRFAHQFGHVCMEVVMKINKCVHSRIIDLRRGRSITSVLRVVVDARVDMLQQVALERVLHLVAVP